MYHEINGSLQIAVHYSDKTQFMLIQGPNQKDRQSLSQNFQLPLGDHKFERTAHYTYLGIILTGNCKLMNCAQNCPVFVGC